MGLKLKAEAKAQAEKKGPKGVGLGTAESRAGEAAVHYAVRELLKGRSIEEVRKNLLTIANDKDRVLNKEWAEAAINTAEWIHDVYGDDVKEVVWDTPSGRQLIGVEGHGTSSDMFIQTKDGKNIGIALKVLDGSPRAMPIGTIKLLEHLELLTKKELSMRKIM